MSFALTVYKNRTMDFSGTVKDADGTAVTLAADDVLRFKIGKRGTTSLEIDNVATANGSVISIDTPASGTYDLRIAQGDTEDLVSGAYEAELAVVDVSDTAPDDPIKHVEHGSVVLVGTLDGETGA